MNFSLTVLSFLVALTAFKSIGVLFLSFFVSMLCFLYVDLLVKIIIALLYYIGKVLQNLDKIYLKRIIHVDLVKVFTSPY